MKQQKLRKRRNAPNITIFVVGEGKSEITYFNDLYVHEELGKAGISLKTNDLPVTATDYMSLFGIAEKKAEIYDIVYCVLDLDGVHKKKAFKNYCDKKKALKSNI